MKKKDITKYLVYLEGRIKEYPKTKKYKKEQEALKNSLLDYSHIKEIQSMLNEIFKLSTSFSDMMKDTLLKQNELKYIGELYVWIFKDVYEFLSYLNQFVLECDYAKNRLTVQEDIEVYKRYIKFYSVAMKFGTQRFLSVSFLRHYTKGNVESFFKLHKNFDPGNFI